MKDLFYFAGVIIALVLAACMADSEKKQIEKVAMDYYRMSAPADKSVKNIEEIESGEHPDMTIECERVVFARNKNRATVSIRLTKNGRKSRLVNLNLSNVDGKWRVNVQ